MLCCDRFTCTNMLCCDIGTTVLVHYIAKISTPVFTCYLQIDATCRWQVHLYLHVIRWQVHVHTCILHQYIHTYMFWCDRYTCTYMLYCDKYTCTYMLYADRYTCTYMSFSISTSILISCAVRGTPVLPCYTVTGTHVLIYAVVGTQIALVYYIATGLRLYSHCDRHTHTFTLCCDKTDKHFRLWQVHLHFCNCPKHHKHTYKLASCDTMVHVSVLILSDVLCCARYTYTYTCYNKYAPT